MADTVYIDLAIEPPIAIRLDSAAPTAHAHANLSDLDRIASHQNLPTWMGSPWPGGSGGSGLLKNIPFGMSVAVEPNFQYLVYGTFAVNGTLNVNGDLTILNGTLAVGANGNVNITNDITIT